MADQLKPLCLVAGKSGGHIIPCLTIAQQKYPEHSIIFFSTNAALDTQLLGTHSFQKWICLPLSMRTGAWYAKLLLLPLLALSFVVSFYQLLKHRPVQLISTGGLVAVPVCTAAWLLRIPIDLYELNAVPGKAITALARCATRMYVCFASAQQFFKHAQVVTYPIRFTPVLTASLSGSNKNPVILIVGGSQGSVALNKLAAVAIASYAKQFPHFSLRVLHQIGALDKRDWTAFYREQALDAHLFTYADDMADYYAQADLVICRAGAGTLFEVYHFSKPCIMVPLEGAGGNHQVENARAMVQEHGELFRLVRQQDVAACTHAIMEFLTIKQK